MFQLLEHGADPNKASTDKYVPTELCVPQPPAFTKLAARNSVWAPHVPTHYNGIPPLKRDPNARFRHGTPALIAASQEGYVEVVRLLLSNRADPNAAVQDSGITSLHAAAHAGK